MTKGFTDKSGNFRPTENKSGVRKSRNQSKKTEGMKMDSGIRMKRDNKKFTTIDSYVDRDILGISGQLPLNSIVEGSGDDYKIVAYQEGSTFSGDSLKHLSPDIKTYEIVVMNDQIGEGVEDMYHDYGKFFAINDQLARRLVKEYLAEGAQFKLFKVTTKVKEVN